MPETLLEGTYSTDSEERWERTTRAVTLFRHIAWTRIKTGFQHNGTVTFGEEEREL
jgi:hypothetical protein